MGSDSSGELVVTCVSYLCRAWNPHTNSLINTGILVKMSSFSLLLTGENMIVLLYANSIL